MVSAIHSTYILRRSKELIFGGFYRERGGAPGVSTNYDYRGEGGPLREK